MYKFFIKEEICERKPEIKLSFWDIFSGRKHTNVEFSNYSGVYIWYNDINSDIYVGSTKNFHDRLNDHSRTLFDNTHPNYKFNNAFKTIGPDHFYVELYPILETRNELFNIETYLIRYFDSVNFGYNIVEDSRCRTFTKKQKIEIGKRLSNANKGKPKSLEHRKKCGESISKANRGENNPMSLLSKEDILYIRNNFKFGESKQYCEMFHISRSLLRRILHLRCYNYPDYIPDDYVKPKNVGDNRMLSDNDVLFIRNNINTMRVIEFANKFNCGRRVISNIIHLKTYKDAHLIPTNYKYLKNGDYNSNN